MQLHPQTLLCMPGQNTSTCLTPPQIDTLNALHRPIADIHDICIHPNLGLGSEAQMTGSFGTFGTNAPSLYGTQYVANYVLDDPNWDWHTYNYSVVQIADAETQGGQTPMISTFLLSMLVAENSFIITTLQMVSFPPAPVSCCITSTSTT